MYPLGDIAESILREDIKNKLNALKPRSGIVCPVHDDGQQHATAAASFIGMI